MTIKHDDELSQINKYCFEKAGILGEDLSKFVINYFQDSFNKDENFHNLDFSGAISTIMKTGNIIFISLFQFAHHVARHFPDSEINAAELFEEVIEGLRELTSFKQPNSKEYVNGIKKVKST